MADFHEGGKDGIRFGGESSIDVTSAIPILECIVVTPEATALQTPAEFVALPLYDGELGVLPGHSPFIGRLGYGELRVLENGKTVRLYVDGGFVQVADNIVSVLTNNAVPAEKLNACRRPRATSGSTSPQGQLSGTACHPRSLGAASSRPNPHRRARRPRRLDSCIVTPRRTFTSAVRRCRPMNHSLVTTHQLTLWLPRYPS